MSWSTQLYFFTQREGGQFFGGIHDKYNAAALLDGKGSPILIRDELKSPVLRGTPDDHFALISTTLGLTQAYTLTIKGKSSVAHAHQTLQKWKEIGKKRNNGDDFAPRAENPLIPQRFVRTSHQRFTAQVLKNKQLLDLLETGECATHRIQVAPHAADARLHLLEVRASLFDESAWGIDWDPIASQTQFALLQEERSHRFSQRMEPILQLLNIMRQELLRAAMQ